VYVSQKHGTDGLNATREAGMSCSTSDSRANDVDQMGTEHDEFRQPRAAVNAEGVGSENISCPFSLAPRLFLPSCGPARGRRVSSTPSDLHPPPGTALQTLVTCRSRPAHPQPSHKPHPPPLPFQSRPQADRTGPGIPADGLRPRCWRPLSLMEREIASPLARGAR
jgi:hypothetical protein